MVIYLKVMSGIWLSCSDPCCVLSARNLLFLIFYLASISDYKFTRGGTGSGSIFGDVHTPPWPRPLVSKYRRNVRVVIPLSDPMLELKLLERRVVLQVLVLQVLQVPHVWLTVVRLV